MYFEGDSFSIRINEFGLRKFIGDLESEIMEQVWMCPDGLVTVRDVFERLKVDREIAYTTVMTTVNRLEEKGILVCVDKIGLAKCYRPVVSRPEFVRLIVDHICQVLISDFPSETLSSFGNIGKIQAS